MVVPSACRSMRGFNTQPPEGGCPTTLNTLAQNGKFQHTAARRRLPLARADAKAATGVSTHSRPKAAAYVTTSIRRCCPVSTHSRPKAAAASRRFTTAHRDAFQHTAARRRLPESRHDSAPQSCFNTQPPEGGCRWKKFAAFA